MLHPVKQILFSSRQLLTLQRHPIQLSIAFGSSGMPRSVSKRNCLFQERPGASAARRWAWVGEGGGRGGEGRFITLFAHFLIVSQILIKNVEYSQVVSGCIPAPGFRVSFVRLRLTHTVDGDASAVWATWKSVSNVSQLTSTPRCRRTRIKNA